MRAPAPLEVEAKLAVDDERALRAIGAAGQIGPYALLRRGVARLHSIYFDSADFVLARHGIALRARRNGRRWEITLKWRGRVTGAVHARPELTEPLPKRPGSPLELPEAFERQVQALLAGRPLEPILVSDVRRELVDVAATDNGAVPHPLAELALDKVNLRAPEEDGARATYCELEVEQKEGTRDDVEALARLLQRQFELTPSTDSKFSHGINLLYAPRLAEYEAPLADGTVRRAAQRLVGRHLARLRANDPGTRLGEDPEALHDMRVAVRRLRALLRFLGGGLPARRAQRLRAELRWLNRWLSPVRDCDVQLQTLDRYESALGTGRRHSLAPFRDYILRERERRRRAMLGGLGSKRYFALLLQLEHFALDRRRVRFESALVPAAEVGRAALERAFRHLLRQGAEAGTSPTDEQLHLIRIRAKRLRYVLEFFRDSTGKPGRRLLKHLVEVQDLLGVYNDATVASAFLDRYVNGAGADLKPGSMLTIGGMMQEDVRRARKARARFHATWKRFAAKRTTADWKAVQRLLRKEAAAVATRPQRPRSGGKPRGTR